MLRCFVYLTILCDLNIVTCFVLPPSFKFFNNFSDSTPPIFLSSWLQNISSDVGGLLVADVDLDGYLDVFFATLDGELHGQLGFVHCFERLVCSQRETHWPIFLSGEQFVTKPVVIPIDAYGRSAVAFVSSRGTIFVFDYLGNPINKIHIPNVILRLSNEHTSTLPIIGATKLIRRVRWAVPHSDVMLNSIKHEHLLYPRSYTDAMVLSASEALQSLIIPVTFSTLNEIDDDLLLSAVVGLPFHMLIHNTWMESEIGSHDEHLPDYFQLVPLELSHINQTRPGFLFSELSVASLPRSHHMSGNTYFTNARDPLAYMLIVPSFSGLLHRVLLPLNSVITDSSGMGHTYFPVVADGVIFSLASSCLLIDCPASSDHVPGLCCLLLDTSSRLHCIDLGSGAPSTIPPTARARATMKTYSMRYTYNASKHGGSVPLFPTFGDVSLVPGCTDHFSSNCDPWVVFPTPDGMVHAVNVRNGSSVFGYPVQVVHSQDSKPSPLTFASGPGLPYTDSSGIFWILFSDTHGSLYHVRLHQFPVTVKQSHICSTFEGVNSCAHVVAQSTTTWLNPVWVRTTRDLTDYQSAGSTETNALLWTTSRGLVLLTVPQSRLIHIKWMNQHRHPVTDDSLAFTPHIQHGITYIDVHKPRQVNGNYPINVQSKHTVLELNHAEHSHTLFYQLSDCPSNSSRTDGSESSAAPTLADFQLKLTDSFGIDISSWSVPKVTEVAKGSALCSGQLEVILPSFTPFRGRVYLHVVHQRTGRLMRPSNPSFYSSVANTAASVVLVANTSWPLLLLALTYSPGLYLFLGLLFLLNQNIPKHIHSQS